MSLEMLVQMAREAGASDLHLESGMPLAMRIRGQLKIQGEPLAATAITAMARELIGDEQWREFSERCSWDLSRSMGGVRCRVNVLRSARGVGLAVRLLTSFQATLQKLNLHPELKRLVAGTHGLVIITGPTGSGKTSTLAALIQEINLTEARHIITIEQPIEYAFTPRQSFIRQREVGRDTPSFEQALVDALREDPDVLMVGEMREPEVMRLTLAAAETGHLVLATMHSSNAAEALQRMAASFAPEIQSSVCAQLADCLVGVVAQRLTYQPEHDLRVPELEVLMATTPVRSLVRQGHFFKLQSVIETSAVEGSWSFARYRDWLTTKSEWSTASKQVAEPSRADVEETRSMLPSRPLPVRARPQPAAATGNKKRASSPPEVDEQGVLVLSADDDDPAAILSELERQKD